MFKIKTPKIEKNHKAKQSHRLLLMALIYSKNIFYDYHYFLLNYGKIKL